MTIVLVSGLMVLGGLAVAVAVAVVAACDRGGTSWSTKRASSSRCTWRRRSQRAPLMGLPRGGSFSWDEELGALALTRLATSHP